MGATPNSEIRDANLVVFVDDTKQLVTIVQRMFDQLGITGRYFNCPTEALAFVREHVAEVRLLVTDQSMTPITGLELIAEVRQVTDCLPIVLASSVQAEVAVEEYHERGVTAVLRKPFTMQELATMIGEVAP